MPREPHIDPPVRLHVAVPESVLAAVDLALFNPVTGKVKYGARSDLITGLLKSWLTQQAAGPQEGEPQ